MKLDSCVRREMKSISVGVKFPTITERESQGLNTGIGATVCTSLYICV